MRLLGREASPLDGWLSVANKEQLDGPVYASETFHSTDLLLHF